ncbi:MAG TPA: PEGA domain-containing protein, partial [Myxococcaceae bacterium]|nr:PEGA domain-containing protein [Myxococcaceae bacterium]
GRAPFRGHTHSEIIRQILIVEPPKMRDLKPGVPARMEQIVARALARNPDDRYRTALEIRDDLQEMLGAGRRMGPGDVARCVEALGTARDETERVPAAVETEPSAMPKPVSTAETLEPGAPSGPSSLPPEGPSAETPQISAGGPIVTTGSTGDGKPFATVLDPSPVGRPRWTWKHVAIIGLAVVGGVVAPFAVGGRDGAGTEGPGDLPGGRAALEVTSTPRATATLDGHAVGATPLRLTDLAPGPHVLKVEMVGPDGTHGSREETMELRAGELARRDVRFGRGHLKLSVTPWAQVAVDGQRVGDSPFPQGLSLWEGPHQVTLHNPTLKVVRELSVMIRPDADEQVTVSLTAE